MISKERFKGMIIGGTIVATISFGLNPTIAQGFNKTIDAAFNKITIVLDGQQVDADNILYKGTTYVPMRKMAEMIGKDVNWNQSTQTAYIGEMNSGSLIYTNEKFFKMDFKHGIIYKYNPNEREDAPNKVVIPKTINGSIGPEVVRGIDHNAFNSKGITEVILPEGITGIGSRAFFGNNLTSIKIPDSVTYIGESAFRANKLTQVIIPENAEVGDYAFDSDVKVIRR